LRSNRYVLAIHKAEFNDLDAKPGGTFDFPVFAGFSDTASDCLAPARNDDPVCDDGLGKGRCK